MALSRETPADVSARFWEKVDLSGDCWVWTRQCNGWGYGVFKFKGRGIHAHRFAYQEAHGPIDGNISVLHRCDNPPCVRPDHLFLGTTADNMADKARKGRGRNGSHTGNFTPAREGGCRKLSDADVLLIQAAFAGGEAQEKIGRRFGVSQPTVSLIVRRVAAYARSADRLPVPEEGETR